MNIISLFYLTFFKQFISSYLFLVRQSRLFSGGIYYGNAISLMKGFWRVVVTFKNDSVKWNNLKFLWKEYESLYLLVGKTDQFQSVKKKKKEIFKILHPFPSYFLSRKEDLKWKKKKKIWKDLKLWKNISRSSSLSMKKEVGWMKIHPSKTEREK